MPDTATSTPVTATVEAAKPPRQYKTMKDVADAIEEASGYEFADLPVMDGFEWFPGPDGKNTFFQRKDNVPMNSMLEIFALFHHVRKSRGPAAEVRVYALPRAGADPKTVKPPTRYTLSKLAPTYGTERMDMDTFVSEVSAELESLADLTADYFVDDDPDDKDEVDPADDEPEVAADAGAPGE